MQKKYLNTKNPRSILYSIQNFALFGFLNIACAPSTVYEKLFMICNIYSYSIAYDAGLYNKKKKMYLPSL